MSQLVLFADLLWKLLVIAALSSTLLLGAFALAQPLLRKISGQLYNRIAQISLSGLLGILFLSFFLLLSLDQDIQVKCFGNFASSQGSFGVTRILAMIWILGVVLLGARDFRLYQGFQRILRRKTLEVKDGYLLVEDDVAPMTFGLFKAQVLVPENLRQDESFPFILAHERVHQQNQDGLWSLLALVMQRLCWFNPLTFWFERGRRLAMEMATDEITVARNNFDPRDYSQALLNVLQREGSLSPHRMGFGAALNFQEMKVRLENLNFQGSSRRKTYYKLAALSILTGGWFLGIGQSLASIQMKSTADEPMMCYQVQHEKILESWLHLESETNKCEDVK